MKESEEIKIFINLTQKNLIGQSPTYRPPAEVSE